ncbi:MAG TPA: hypothetical protein VEX38_03005 [Fimbriimonadaceae bacterium]|nr:hypothetical protein [Fimbriimonadaceae bacterium]
MSPRLFGCRKFKRLSNETLDREPSASEARFLFRHRSVCRPCREEEEAGAQALDMLRSSALDVEPRPNFDERLLRRLKIQSVRTSLTFWSPAVLGAAVAGFLLLAALQMVAQSGNLPQFKLPGGEAKRIANPNSALPSLELPRSAR